MTLSASWQAEGLLPAAVVAAAGVVGSPQCPAACERKLRNPAPRCQHLQTLLCRHLTHSVQRQSEVVAAGAAHVGAADDAAGRALFAAVSAAPAQVAGWSSCSAAAAAVDVHVHGQGGGDGGAAAVGCAVQRTSECSAGVPPPRCRHPQTPHPHQTQSEQGQETVTAAGLACQPHGELQLQAAAADPLVGRE